MTKFDFCECGNGTVVKPRIMITDKDKIRIYASCSVCKKSVRLHYRVFVDKSYKGLVSLRDDYLYEDKINLGAWEQEE